MTSVKTSLSTLSAAFIAVFFFTGIALAGNDVIITGNTSAGENQPGWMFNRDASTATPFEFNTDASKGGKGSLYVKPIGANASDKFIAENFINALMKDVDSISYNFKIGNGGDANDEEQFYMNVYANFGQSPDDKFYDCRYTVIPTVGSTAEFTKVKFNPNQAYPVTTRGGASASPYPCPAIPKDMNLLSPGSNIRVFAINVGDTSTSDLGLDGYLDKVETKIKNKDVTYDFEPRLVATDKSQCKDRGWENVTDEEGNPFSSEEQCKEYVKSQDN